MEKVPNYVKSKNKYLLDYHGIQTHTMLRGKTLDPGGGGGWCYSTQSWVSTETD